MNIRYKLARFAFRRTKPFIGYAKRQYDHYKQLLPDHPYNAWSTQNEDICFVDTELNFHPLISVIVPVFNPDSAHFLRMVYSVVNQHYDNWELILVNTSTNKYQKAQTKQAGNIDTRIKIINTENKGISANTNRGIEEARGDYIVFFDHDDVIHPCALHSAVECLQGNEKPELIYTDEDKINHQGSFYYNPFFKPDWSPDLIENVNYINHLCIIKTELVRGVRGLRSKFDGAQDYDLLLRVIDKFQPQIRHIPRVLYHWRAAKGSTASKITNKDYIFSAGQRALQEHLHRIGATANAKIIESKPGFYEAVYKPTDYSLIIGRVSPAKYIACAKWLNLLFEERTEVKRELIIGDWYKEFIGTKYAQNLSKIKIITLDDRSNEYWQQATKKSSYPVILGFKTAILPLKKQSLDKLAAAVTDPRRFVVSPPIISDSQVVLDSGITEISGFPKQMFEGCTFGQDTYYGSTEWVRNAYDISTNIIAIKSADAKNLFKVSKNYELKPTIRTFNSKMPTDQHCTVWAHSAVEFVGLLDTSGSAAETKHLLSFNLDSRMYFDNWRELDAIDY